MSENPVPVLVSWIDAFDGPQGWTTLDGYDPTPVTPVSIGWHWADRQPLDGYLTIYSSYFIDDDGELVVSNPIHIPLGMMKVITPLSSV